MNAPTKKGIDPTLENAIKKLLKEVMSEKKENTATITDKMKVIDRALKLEAIRNKMGDGEYGSGFFDGDNNGG